MNGTTVFLTAIGYVSFLFLIAWWGRGGRFASSRSRAFVYALSLAVYWAVGRGGNSDRRSRAGSCHSDGAKQKARFAWRPSAHALANAAGDVMLLMAAYAGIAAIASSLRDQAMVEA
jgi:hypothetical protein